MNALRGVATLAVAIAFGLAIACSEDPAMLAIGLGPLVWIAVEGVWRLIPGPAPRTARKPQAESRTGMRRDPKGLPNA
jgi:hypothetical protein